MRTTSWFAGLGVSVLALLTPLAVGASGGNSGPPGSSGGHAPLYYLALGDSLSVGFQPVPPGPAQPTNQGYANDIAGFYQGSLPNLKLVEMGCPGESTATMINGGICSYAHGSQLADAVSFLHAHGKFTALVTIDIGANNVDGCISGTTISEPCILSGFAAAGSDLPVILAALHSASPSTPIVGMNYYDPYLAAWFTDGFKFGPLSGGSLLLTDGFNTELEGIYSAFGVPVADVETAFNTFNQTPAPVVPVDVATICVETWMCTLQNIHANAGGYALIASAFESAIGVLAP